MMISHHTALSAPGVSYFQGQQVPAGGRQSAKNPRGRVANRMREAGGCDARSIAKLCEHRNESGDKAGGRQSDPN